jgi:hypothetical protein
MPPQFATQFRADFEAAMAALGVAHPHAIPPLQRAMAAFFFTFVPRTTSLYVALAQRMASAGWNGAVCSLNYERLLELSLGRARVQATVGIPTNAAKSVELCLPHGCCHIFCEGVRGSSQGISFTGFGVSTDGPVVVISNPIQHRQRIENDAFPPVMSYFEPNKRTTSGTSFIVGQRERWGQLARAATSVVCVGIRVRPQDEHIWKPIADSPGRVVYCSGASAGAEFDTWAQANRSGRPSLVLPGFFHAEFAAVCGELGL